MDKIVKSLESLPEFGHSPFNGSTLVEICHLARIRYIPSPNDQPAYMPEAIFGVVGRSPDYQRIFTTRD